MQPIDMTYSEDLQLEILAYILHNPAFLLTHPDVVKPQYFTNPILMAIAGAYLGQENVIVLTPNELHHLVHETDGEYAAAHRTAIREAIAKLIKTKYNPDYIEQVVVKFARHHAVAQAWMDGIDDIQNTRYEEAIEKMRLALAVGENLADLGTSLSQIDPVKIFTDNPGDYYPTGYPTLDACLSGGLGKGELGLIVGTAGRGKSMLCQDMAISGSARRPKSRVLLVSLEMGENRYFQRILSRISKHGKKDAMANIQSIQRRLTSFRTKTGSDIVVRQFPAGCAKVTDIEALVRRLRANCQPIDLLIVDYADLLAPMTKRHDQWLELMETYTHLRGLAVRCDIPVWTPTQGKTSAYRKAVLDLADVGGSIGKVQIADVILMLNQTSDEKDIGELRVTISKARNDQSDLSVKMSIDYERMKLTDRGLS